MYILERVEKENLLFLRLSSSAFFFLAACLAPAFGFGAMALDWNLARAPTRKKTDPDNGAGSYNVYLHKSGLRIWGPIYVTYRAEPRDFFFHSYFTPSV